MSKPNYQPAKVTRIPLAVALGIFVVLFLAVSTIACQREFGEHEYVVSGKVLSSNEDRAIILQFDDGTIHNYQFELTDDLVRLYAVTKIGDLVSINFVAPAGKFGHKRMRWLKIDWKAPEPPAAKVEAVKGRKVAGVEIHTNVWASSNSGYCDHTGCYSYAK